MHERGSGKGRLVDCRNWKELLDAKRKRDAEKPDPPNDSRPRKSTKSQSKKKDVSDAVEAFIKYAKSLDW